MLKEKLSATFNTLAGRNGKAAAIYGWCTVAFAAATLATVGAVAPLTSIGIAVSTAVIGVSTAAVVKDYNNKKRIVHTGDCCAYKK